MTETLAAALAARNFTALESHPAGVRLVVGFASQSEALAARAAVSAIPQRPRPDAATTGELIAALKAAKPGATIRLAPGNYRGVSIKGLALPGVTITGDGAVLHDLLVQGASGLTFTDLEFHHLPDAAPYPFTVRGSREIHFRAVETHGSLDGNPQNDRAGLMIRESERVTVTGSEFHELYIGVSILDSRHIAVTGSRFHDLQKDGCIASGSSHVVIVGNEFSDFYPVAGDHPDAIQFFGSGTSASASDLDIRANVIRRGGGEKYQGIFLRDGSGERPFLRVSITENLVLGCMYAGIAVDGAQDVVVAENTVTGFPDMYSSIRTLNVTDLRVTDNRAQKFLAAGREVKIPTDGNQKIPAATDGGVALLAARAVLR